MLVFDEELETELLQNLKTPKLVDEIKFENIETPMVMGQPNPHFLEAVKRQLTSLQQAGLVEMEYQDKENLTGSKKWHTASGRWVLTQKGRNEAIARAKRALGYKTD
jgi:hypothetical protein